MFLPKVQSCVLPISLVMHHIRFCEELEEYMAAIESKDETVFGVFKDFYVVPSYQREYVWGETRLINY